MKLNKKIQIIALLAIITIALIAVGISANESINEKPGPQYQGNSYCPDSDDCPQPYCNNYTQ